MSKAILRIDMEFDYPKQEKDQSQKLALSVGFAIVERIKHLANVTGGKCLKVNVTPMGEPGTECSPMEQVDLDEVRRRLQDKGLHVTEL